MALLSPAEQAELERDKQGSKNCLYLSRLNGHMLLEAFAKGSRSEIWSNTEWFIGGN